MTHSNGSQSSPSLLKGVNNTSSYHGEMDYPSSITDYGELVEKMILLKTELQSANTLNSTLQNKNESLLIKHKEGKSSLSRLQNRYEETRASLSCQLDLANDIQSKLNKREIELRSSLDKERREIDDLFTKGYEKQRIGEKHYLEAQLKEKIEKGFSDKLENLRKKVDEWQRKYYEAQRDNEVTKVQHETVSSTINNSIQSENDSLRVEVVALQERLQKALETEENDVTSKKESFNEHKLQLIMDQKGVLEEQLRKELKECSKLNEIKNSEIIDLTSSHEIKQAEVWNRIAINESAAHAAKTEADHSKNQIQHLKSLNKEYKEKWSNLDIELTSLKEFIIEQDKTLQVTNEKLKSEKESYCHETKLEIISMKKKISSLLEERSDFELQLTQSIAVAEDVKQQQIINQEQSKREGQKILEKYLNENLSLTTRVADLEDEMKSTEVEYASTVQKLKHECESCRLDAQYISNEKIRMESEVESSQKELDETKIKLTTVNISLQHAYDKIEIMGDENEKCHQYQSDLKSRSSLKLTTAEKSLLDTTNMMYTLEKDLNKERKRSQAYKEKALEAHKKYTRSRKC